MYAIESSQYGLGWVARLHGYVGLMVPMQDFCHFVDTRVSQEND